MKSSEGNSGRKNPENASLRKAAQMKLGSASTSANCLKETGSFGGEGSKWSK